MAKPDSAEAEFRDENSVMGRPEEVFHKASAGGELTDVLPRIGLNSVLCLAVHLGREAVVLGC